MDGDGERGSARRRGAAWLAIAAVSLLVVGIGLVGMRDGPPPMPEVLEPRDEVRLPVVGNPDSREAAAATRMPVWDQQAHNVSPPFSAPSLPVQFRVKTRGARGRNDTNYSGPCVVLDDQRTELATVPVRLWPRECSVSVPMAMSHLRFAIPGHRPIEREVPPPRDGVRDVGTLVFEPDAALQLVVVGGPTATGGMVRCTVQGADRFFASDELELRAGRGGVTVAAPSERELQIEVTSASGAGTYIHFPATSVTLRGAETRTLEFDVATLLATVIRVVGPSRELLPHLDVRWGNGAAPSDPAAVRLDGDGRAVLHGIAVGSQQFELGRTIGLCPLDPQRAADGSEVELKPRQAVVGLRLRGDDGASVPFAACVQPDHGFGEVAVVHVVVAAQLSAFDRVSARTEALGVMHWPTSAIVWHGDLGALQVATAARRARVVVEATGPPPEPAWRPGVRLIAADGTAKSGLRRDSRFVFDDLDGGDYRVQWWVSDQAGPVIAAKVALAAGSVQSLSAPWPQPNVWHGEVANWRAIPALDRLPAVRFGGTAWTAGAKVPIDEVGRFELWLPEGGEPPTEVTFQFAAMSRAGRMLSLDRLGRRLLIEHPVDVQWVDVEVHTRFGGTWMALVHGPDGPRIWTVVQREHPRLFLPERGTLSGQLIEAAAGLPAGVTTAWFTIDGTQRNVTIAPEGGHWCEVTLARDVPRLHITMIDIDGIRHGPDERSPSAGTIRCWLPASVTTVELDLQAGGVQRFAGSATSYTVR